ncbi:PIG-L family deacetylase [Halobacillus andaensis]|uniref:PIG-L family deacetylase n=1 Tax=Halobacillus andaensis TaxID=1176239 RepID=UPI003D720AF0
MRNKEKHVLVIFPHPDDESFGASGTISKFRSEGIPVTYLCGTLGEMGRNMGSPVFANRETLYTFRKKELQEASRKLDINVELLGYRDKTLEFEPLEELASHLKARILAWGERQLLPIIQVTAFTRIMMLWEEQS